MPVRLQRRRARGWRMPATAVYVGRPTKWGNPFLVGRDGTAADCLRLYRLLACGFICLTTAASVASQRRARTAMEEAPRELRGKDQLCWCPPGRPCHADVLLEIANG